MLDHLKGRLVEYTPGRAVVQCGPVALALEVPASSRGLEPDRDREVTFYTRLMLKDEELRLFGFQSLEERTLFNLVLGVSGFGPRLALSLLGLFTVSQFYLAVLEENMKELMRAPGVGRKAAQRLVFELREKLPGALPGAELESIAAAGGSGKPLEEISEALCSLGYSREEALQATRRISAHPGASSEDLLKAALQVLAGGSSPG